MDFGYLIEKKLSRKYKIIKNSFWVRNNHREGALNLKKYYYSKYPTQQKIAYDLKITCDEIN